MNWSAGKIGTINQRSAHANDLSIPPIGCVLHLLGLPGAGNKIYDRSPYGNIGTITGATWTRTPGGLWCLDFDGSDDYVDCGNINLDYITVEAWIKRDRQGVTEIVISKGARGVSPNRVWSLYLTDDNSLVFQWSTNGSNTPTAMASAVGINWTHIAGTYGGTRGKAYVNGVETLGDAAAGTIYQFDRNVTLGRRPLTAPAPPEWFEGLIALPRIWNRALSALEIQNHFNREKHLFGVV